MIETQKNITLNIQENDVINSQEITAYIKNNKSYESQVIQFDEISLFSQNKISNSGQQINNQNINKVILNKLSGYLPTGLNAILGSSGAGKTSFLNILAKRIENTKKLKISGSVKVNQQEYTFQNFNKFAGYVMQNDYLLPSLTVREYIQFAADMKLPLSPEEKLQEVNDLLKQLGLTHCQNTRIGDEMTKGISGGERKRVSIGIELVGSPQILFLDEPTSGLDSFSSYQLIWRLKEISQKENKTIVFTIHQPSSDIYQLFDRILLMSQGSFVYQGPTNQIINYFNNLNFICPIHANPPDYFIEIIHSSHQQNIDLLISQYNQNILPKIQQESQSIFQHNQSNQKSINPIYTNKQMKDKDNQIKTSFKVQKLLERQIISLSRNKIMLNTRFIQVVVIGLFIGAVFWNLSRNDSSYKDSYQIAQVLFLTQLGMFSQSMNPQVITFLGERGVFLKEECSNLYTALPYYLSKVIPEIFSCSFFAFLSSWVVYWMIGFKNEVSTYFFFALVYTLQSNVGNAFGILAGSLFKQPKIGIAFALTFIAPQILFGGIFKNRQDYPSWIGWMQYITPTMYSFTAVARNEFEDTTFQYNPVEYLNLDIDKWACVFVLLGLFFFFHFIAYFCLLQKRTRLQ